MRKDPEEKFGKRRLKHQDNRSGVEGTLCLYFEVEVEVGNMNQGGWLSYGFQ